MVGKRRMRTALGALGAATLLLGLGTFGPSPVDADVVTIDGLAFGIDGEITIPAQDPQDPPEVIDIEPIPAVVLPDDGTGKDGIGADELNYEVEDILDIAVMSVRTQGSLTSTNQAGGVISDTLVDNFSLLPDQTYPEGFIQADEIESSCLVDEGRNLAGVNFNGLVVGSQAISEEPAPNTEVEYPDYGTVRFNVQERSGDRVQVVALEIELAIEDGPTVSMRVGQAECGTEVIDEVVPNEPFVPVSDLADAFEGDPEFTG